MNAETSRLASDESWLKEQPEFKGQSWEEIDATLTTQMHGWFLEYCVGFGIHANADLMPGQPTLESKSQFARLEQNSLDRIWASWKHHWQAATKKPLSQAQKLNQTKDAVLSGTLLPPATVEQEPIVSNRRRFSSGQGNEIAKTLRSGRRPNSNDHLLGGDPFRDCVVVAGSVLRIEPCLTELQRHYDEIFVEQLSHDRFLGLEEAHHDIWVSICGFDRENPDTCPVAKFAGKSSLRAWLRRVIHNRLNDRRRQINRLRFVELQDTFEAVQSAPASDIEEYKDLLSQYAQAAFTRLKCKHRRSLIYRIKLHLSNRETAKLLCVSEGESSRIFNESVAQLCDRFGKLANIAIEPMRVGEPFDAASHELTDVLMNELVHTNTAHTTNSSSLEDQEMNDKEGQPRLPDDAEVGTSKDPIKSASGHVAAPPISSNPDSQSVPIRSSENVDPIAHDIVYGDEGNDQLHKRFISVSIDDDPVAIFDAQKSKSPDERASVICLDGRGLDGRGIDTDQLVNVVDQYFTLWAEQPEQHVKRRFQPLIALIVLEGDWKPHAELDNWLKLDVVIVTDTQKSGVDLYVEHLDDFEERVIQNSSDHAVTPEPLPPGFRYRDSDASDLYPDYPTEG